MDGKDSCLSLEGLQLVVSVVQLSVGPAGVDKTSYLGHIPEGVRGSGGYSPLECTVTCCLR